jgi:hypothetical protein
MATYAVMNGDIVENIIVAESLEIAESFVRLPCVEYTEEAPFQIGDKLTTAQIKKLADTKAKREADIAKAEAKAEADRVKAIEAENERLRKIEADRLVLEEASKPKPVTGIFVRVEKN